MLARTWQSALEGAQWVLFSASFRVQREQAAPHCRPEPPGSESGLVELTHHGRGNFERGCLQIDVLDDLAAKRGMDLVFRSINLLH